jgi:hypothetical protein
LPVPGIEPRSPGRPVRTNMMAFSTAAGDGDGAVVTGVKYSLKHYFHQSGIRSATETSASVILVSLQQFFSNCGPRRAAGGV